MTCECLFSISTYGKKVEFTLNVVTCMFYFYFKCIFDMKDSVLG